MRRREGARLHPGARHEGPLHPQDRGQVLPESLLLWDDPDGPGGGPRGEPPAQRLGLRGEIQRVKGCFFY